MDVGSFPHQVTRLVFDTGQPYQEFRARYEQAVPELDAARLAGFAERGAPWQEVVADADASAPHGFFIFWRLETTPVMTLAGDPALCTTYLMGNHVIAEQMYRHDPSVMLYVPLRTVIYVDDGSRTRFAIDQPSTVLASFGSPSISEVGIELDRKLGALLEALDVRAGGGLGHPRVASIPGPDGDRSSRPGTHDRADRPSQ
jgi:uncharacterized protein (DUF302 family)